MADASQAKTEPTENSSTENGTTENAPAEFPPIYISEEKLTELKDVFGMFSGGTSKCATSDLGSMIRAVGQHPTEAEIASWKVDVDKAETGYFEFTDFQNLMATKMKSIDPEDEIRMAFETFDKDGSRTITTAQLREIMTSMGEVLSSDEVDEMIQTADTDNDGVVHYDEFLAILLTS